MVLLLLLLPIILMRQCGFLIMLLFSGIVQLYCFICFTSSDFWVRFSLVLSVLLPWIWIHLILLAFMLQFTNFSNKHFTLVVSITPVSAVDSFISVSPASLSSLPWLSTIFDFCSATITDHFTCGVCPCFLPSHTLKMALAYYCRLSHSVTKCVFSPS